MKKVAIIGGGMSGIICALEASRNKEIEVTIYERLDQIGKKILITGNGKCNISNRVINASMYATSNRERLQELLEGFDCEFVIDYFRSLGVLTKYIRNGLYPVSNQASSVLNCLVLALKEQGVRIITDTKIEDIQFADGNYIINKEKYDSAVITVGGKAGVYKECGNASFALFKKLGLESTPSHPGLTGFVCKGNFKDISGVRSDAEISLLKNGTVVASEEGELQLTEYGISGIAAFNLSLYFNRSENCSLVIDLIPQFSKEELFDNIVERREAFGERKLVAGLLGITNDKLVTHLLKELGLDENRLMKSLQDNELEAFVAKLKEWVIEIDKVRDYQFSQVMVGGIELEEIDENCQTQKHSKLFVCGEALDVTGKCGGYNLHFAFCTGYRAGRYLQTKMMET